VPKELYSVPSDRATAADSIWQPRRLALSIAVASAAAAMTPTASVASCYWRCHSRPAVYRWCNEINRRARPWGYRQPAEGLPNGDGGAGRARHRRGARPQRQWSVRAPCQAPP